MKSRESSSFALSIHQFSSTFFREIVRVGNVRKERDRVCPSTLRTRPRIADNSGEKGSKERKLEELDSSRMQGISGILPRKQVSFCDDYSLFPYSNASLPPSILQPFPIISPNRFATTIMGRSVASRCNGSNLDRLYPRAGSLPPKVPPHPRPCRLEPGNRNRSFLLSIRWWESKEKISFLEWMKIFSRELDNPGINDVIGSIDIFHAMLVREFGSDFSRGGWEERRWGARGECSEEKSRWAIVGRGEKGVGVKVYGEVVSREKVGGARISCDYCTPTINFR